MKGVQGNLYFQENWKMCIIFTKDHTTGFQIYSYSYKKKESVLKHNFLLNNELYCLLYRLLSYSIQWWMNRSMTSISCISSSSFSSSCCDVWHIFILKKCLFFLYNTMLVFLIVLLEILIVFHFVFPSLLLFIWIFI